MTPHRIGAVLRGGPFSSGPVAYLPAMHDEPDAPRALRDPAEAARRRAMLTLPHAAPLAREAERLRAVGGAGLAVPDVDPMDGGAGARILFLLEKPGPRAAEGFVSQDNDDPTAEASWRFRRAAGLARRDVVFWNTAPWWNGTIRFTAAERARGLAELPAFLSLLPDLRAAVMVGRQAERARSLLEGRGLRLFASAHPSPQVRAGNRARWDAIPGVWAEAARTLG